MAYYDKLKERVIDALGGKCADCGETQLAYLTLVPVEKGPKKGWGWSSVWNNLLRNKEDRAKWKLLCWVCMKRAGRLRKEKVIPTSPADHLESNIPPPMDEEELCPNLRIEINGDYRE